MVIVEVGSFMMMDDSIEMAIIFGDGSYWEENFGFWGKVFLVGKCLIIGESLFMMVFMYVGIGKKCVFFVLFYFGWIIFFDLLEYGGKVIC